MKKYHRWTKEEVEILKKEVPKLLPNKTLYAISQKLNELAWKRKWGIK